MTAAIGRVADPMAESFAAMDGIRFGTHVQNLAVLETGEVCAVPYAYVCTESP